MTSAEQTLCETSGTKYHVPKNMPILKKYHVPTVSISNNMLNIP